MKLSEKISKAEPAWMRDHTIKTWSAEAAALEAKINELRAALLLYGVHTDECDSQENGPDTCDCGFDAACEIARR